MSNTRTGEMERRDNLVTVVRVDHNHVKFKFPPSLVLSKITVLGREEEIELYNFHIMTTSVCQQESLLGNL